jgi:serine O-acetyltransferase
MIQNKEDLAYYLKEDRKHFDAKPSVFDWLYKTEKYYIWKFITALRNTEYLKNTQKTFFDKIYYNIMLIRFYRIMHKTQIYIYPNVFAPGLYIPHLGHILISAQAKIGRNCTVRPGTLIASNLGPSNNKLRVVTVGDNVEFSSGCKILCKKIGNNVSVGPNAVVTKNVPDNSIVMGNPAEIIPKLM